MGGVLYNHHQIGWNFLGGLVAKKNARNSDSPQVSSYYLTCRIQTMYTWQFFVQKLDQVYQKGWKESVPTTQMGSALSYLQLLQAWTTSILFGSLPQFLPQNVISFSTRPTRLLQNPVECSATLSLLMLMAEIRLTTLGKPYKQWDFNYLFLNWWVCRISAINLDCRPKKIPGLGWLCPTFSHHEKKQHVFVEKPTSYFN